MNNIAAHKDIVEEMEEELKHLREENELLAERLFNCGKEILRLEEILSEAGLEDQISIYETTGTKND